MTAPRFRSVPLEIADGSIGGVLFGLRVKVLARSPKALLIWNAGERYTSGQDRPYGPSSLVLITDRTRHSVARDYVTLSHGGRLDRARLMLRRAEIDAAFGDGATSHITLGRPGACTTILFDGGGDPLTPARPAMKRSRVG